MCDGDKTGLETDESTSHFLPLVVALFSGLILALFLTPQVAGVLIEDIPSQGYRTLAMVLLFSSLVYLVVGYLVGAMLPTKALVIQW